MVSSTAALTETEHRMLDSLHTEPTINTTNISLALHRRPYTTLIRLQKAAKM